MKIPRFLLPFAILAFIMMLCDCQRRETKGIASSGPDTLKVVTLYGPTSFFIYRGDTMGIDYENVKRFAQDEGMFLQVKTLNNVKELVEALKNNEAQLAAYPVPYIGEYNDSIIYGGPKEISTQVIVQKKAGALNDVTDLIGKDVYVEKGSKFHFRLENLNEEIGGGINIKPLDSDTIISEDFLQMVDSGEIEYAVIDSRTASLYDNAFPALSTSLKISSEQAASWALAPGLDSLASKIDSWENRTHASDFVRDIYKRYYDRAITEAFDVNLSYFKKLPLERGGNVSPFDAVFKKYSPTSGYDWELLAAIAFCESRYNPSVESRFGAFGLMQVMPSTAKAVDIDPSALSSPDANVNAAAKILAKIDESFKNKVPDPHERMKFVVASYNSGPGHIFDSMALAEKNGLDPQKWNGNVSVAALMKSRPEYYNDPVVKHGYFRGRETVDFVDHVTSIYNYLHSFRKSKK